MSNLNILITGCVLLSRYEQKLNCPNEIKPPEFYTFSRIYAMVEHLLKFKHSLAPKMHVIRQRFCFLYVRKVIAI